jgi:Methane oxygenase PmoA
MPFSRRLFLGTAAAAAMHAQKKAYTLEPDPAGMTLKTPDGRTVFTYLTRKPDNVPLEGNSACCFHPVNTPSGERVTDIAPPDHRDHRGMFFAWQSMDFHRKDGVVRGDFWGWGHFAPTEGRAIVNRDLRLVRSDAASAEVAVRNDWNIQGEKVLDEATTARVHDQGAARIFDMLFRFSSDSDVTINQVAFTGLCVRCRKDGQAYFSDPKGKVTLPDSNALKPELNWPSSEWYSYTIALNSGKTVAAAVIDHPGNPRSTWHEPRLVSFLNPCIVALQPVTILAGQPLTLRYRVVAHDGEFPGGLLNRLAAEFRRA